MLKNGIYNILSNFIRRVLSIISVPILIKIIGINEYGLWTLAFAFIGFAEVAEAGLSLTTTYFLASDIVKKDDKGISQTLTITGLAMLSLASLAAVILFLKSKAIVSLIPTLQFNEQVIVANAVKIGSVVIWGRLVQQILVGVEQAYERYDIINIIKTVDAVLANLGLLAVAFLSGKIEEMMWFKVYSTLLIFGIHLIFVSNLLRNVRFRPILTPKKAVLILRYSLNTWFTSIGSLLFSKVDRLIVGSLLGSRFLGIYGVITNITEQINTFSALPIQPLLPRLTHFISSKEGSKESIQIYVMQAFQINAAVALGMSGILFILSKDVLKVMASGYVQIEDIKAFQIMTVIYAIYSLNAVGYYSLFSLSKTFYLMIVQLIGGILSLVLMKFFGQIFQFVGIAIGNSGFILTLLLNFESMNTLKISLKTWLSWIIFPIFSFAIVICLGLIIPDNLIIRVILALVYFVTVAVWFFSQQFTFHNKLLPLISIVAKRF